MIEFDKIMNEYFISYTLLFEPSIKRPGNNLGTILIKKINLSKVEMSHIKTKLKKMDGLRLMIIIHFIV